MRQTATKVIFEILAGIVVLGLLAVTALAIRLANGPLDINMVRGNIEAALSEARDGRSVTIDAITLEWLAAERRIVLVANDLIFLDADGRDAARAGRTEIILDATALTMGRIAVLQLRMAKGWLSFVREGAAWTVAGEPVGQIGSPEPVVQTPTNADRLLDLTGQTLAGALRAIRNQVQDVAIERVQIDDFEIVFRDHSGEDFARFSAAQGSLVRDRNGTRLQLSGRSDPQLGLPVGMAVDLQAPADFSRISGEFGFAGWSLGDFIARFGCSAERFSGLSADISLGVEVTDDGGLSDMSARAEIASGTVSTDQRDIAIDALSVEAAYDRSADELTLSVPNLGSSIATGELRVWVSDLLHGEAGGDLGGDGRGMRAFRLESPQLRFDLRPVFDQVWDFRRVTLRGDVDWAGQVLKLDALSLRRDDVTIAMRGELSRVEEVSEGNLPIRLQLAAEFSGDQTIQDVLGFWPVSLTPGTRRYLYKNILSGDIGEVIARIDLRPDSLKDGILADEAVDLQFAARNVAVKFLHDIPAVTGARAQGKLTGNSFRIDYWQGALQGWAVDEGFVHYPQLNPAGNDMKVFAKARGSVTEMMQMISDSRFQLQARSGFDPTRLAGRGEVTFRFSRPTGEGRTLADATISAKGQATGGAFKSVFNGIDLTEAIAQIDLTQDAITVTGYGDLGPSPVQFTWRDLFTDNNGPATVQASGEITPDFLNQFGILGRAYLSGGVPADISATISGAGIERADVALDFGPARLIVDELGWTKPIDEPANGQLRYTNNAGEPHLIGRFSAPDLAFEGDIALAQNGGIASADLERAFLKDRIDVTGTIRRTPQDELAFELRGALLDVSDFLGSIGDLGAGVGVQESGLEAHMRIDAEVDRLVLRDGLEMSEATLSVAMAGADGLQQVMAGGLTQTGALFSAKYDATEEGPALISLRAADAGFVTNALFGLDLIEGGQLDLNGQLGTDARPSDILVRLEDVRLKEAPAFTQVLSLASLRGLNDTLSGDGVLFTEIEAPIRIQNGQFQISGGRASGPALGMTARGWFDSNTDQMNIDGVLVPSFGVNSALGGIPIVGDLMVGRQGEGIFSISYGIRGTLQEAQVSVNPLSAITPGVMRRIFESPEEDLLPPAPPEAAPLTEPSPRAANPPADQPTSTD